MGVQGRRVLWVLISAFLLGVQTVGAETIKIGYFEHAPHMYTVNPGEKPVGATVRYFETVASQMGYSVKWVPLPISRVFLELQDGSIDGCAHMVKNAALDNYVYYGDTPYHFAQPIFVVPITNPLTKINTVADVKGYSLGWIGGSEPSSFVRQNGDKLKLEINVSWETNLKKLMAGRLDAVHDLNAYTLVFAAKKLNIEQQIKVLPLPDSPLPVYVLFSKASPKGKDLIAKYNKLQASKPFTDGEYKAYVEEELKTVK